MTGAAAIPSAASAAFDYALLSGDAAGRAREAAEFIRGRHAGITGSIIEIGSRLLSVKADLEHGQFAAWLAAEFDWSDRTAQNYMAAARAFEGKGETVSYLPPTTVYQLARAADPIRREVLAAIEQDRPQPERVRDMLDDAKKAEASRRAAEKASPEQRKKEADRKAREDRARRKAFSDAANAQYQREKALVAAAQMILEGFGGDVGELRGLLKEAGLLVLSERLENPFGFEIVSGVSVPRVAMRPPPEGEGA